MKLPNLADAVAVARRIDTHYNDNRRKDKRRMASWQHQITSDPHVCDGKPCIQGTRVMVSVIIDNLAAGETHELIIRGCHVEEEDIQAALRYAADLARDRVVALPAGAECCSSRSTRTCTPTLPACCGSTGHDALTVFEQRLPRHRRVAIA